MYTEEQPGDAAVMLFIKDLREEDSGDYNCKGYYASTEEMYATVQISTYSKYIYILIFHAVILLSKTMRLECNFSLNFEIPLFWIYLILTLRRKKVYQLSEVENL